VDGNLIILVELLLVFGLVFWFGWSQLRSLKRDREARERRRDDDPPRS
jgi:hypothetical protein